MKKHLKILIAVALYIGLILLATQSIAIDGKAIKETVRMREKATADSKIVELISENDKVEIISEDGEWYKVKYKNEDKTYTGYVRKDMISVDGKVEKTSNTDSEKEKTEEKETTESREKRRN